MEKRSILLVEDNHDDEILTLDALERVALVNPIVVARDGAEALDYLYPPDGPARDPCLVMLDLKLPKVNGKEVLRRIRADARTRHIPVVVLTTSNEPEDIRQCYDNGANSYVRKPVEFDRFTEAVRQVGLYWLLINESVI